MSVADVDDRLVAEGAGPKAPVLIVGNFLSLTGGNRGVCEDMAARLPTQGWPVLTTSANAGRLPRFLDMIRTAWRRRHEYALAVVDVYSGLSFIWAEAVCWTLRRAGKPYILTLHGGNLPRFAQRWPRRVRRLLRSAAAVTTPSRYLHEQMAAYREDLRLQPNPLDLSCYAFRLRARPRPRLVWLRAFHRIYNPLLAPQVVARLVQEFPDICLSMVGPDKGDGSRQATLDLAESLGVGHRMTLPGGVPKGEVAAWLDRGDIFLNTTHVDNTPISVMEAMACGLCVVSTDVGGLPYLLDHGRDGLLVPPDDPERMAGAVRRLLTEGGLAEQLSGNARRKVERFDWSVVLPQWERLLTAVARSHRDLPAQNPPLRMDQVHGP